MRSVDCPNFPTNRVPDLDLTDFEKFFEAAILILDESSVAQVCLKDLQFCSFGREGN